MTAFGLQQTFSHEKWQIFETMIQWNKTGHDSHMTVTWGHFDQRESGLCSVDQLETDWCPVAIFMRTLHNLTLNCSFDNRRKIVIAWKPLWKYENRMMVCPTGILFTYTYAALFECMEALPWLLASNMSMDSLPSTIISVDGVPLSNSTLLYKQTTFLYFPFLGMQGKVRLLRMGI